MSASKWKQKIIDDYMNASGRNSFVPSEFLAWLRNFPDHECYPIFFGMSDEEAAFAYREEMVRKWVSGLRLVVRREEAKVRHIGAIEVSEYPMPMLHSPVDRRRDGGGYIHTDPNDPTHLAELARQGAVAMAAWIERYQGIANLLGVDVSGASAIRIALDAAAERINPKKDEAA